MKIIKSNQSSVTVEIDGLEVHFEKVDKGEFIEHSQEWLMEGYTGHTLTHTAVSSFCYGSDDFEEIKDIEEI